MHYRSQTLKFRLTDLSILFVAILTACQNPTIVSTPIPLTPNSSPVTQNNELPPEIESQSKIEFKGENGSNKFTLKMKDDGAKLVGDKDREIARLKSVDGKVKIKTPSEKTLGYVVIKDGVWKLENAEQNRELYVLRRQSDGDYKLETGSDGETYRIKQRDYGLEIETPDKKSLYKVKIKENKTTLQDSSGKTVFSLKSSMIPIAIACFGFDVLTLEQQAGLAYAVNASGG